MNESQIELQEITDPEEIVRSRSQSASARRNSDWLQAHWHELLPGAVGKFLAVAGQEAYLADSPTEAWALARSAHPDDDGVLCQYVRLDRGPRFYAHRR